jgi:hypothetical protein
MSPLPPIAPDATIVLGLASTATPFARTSEEEAERWLRILRLSGEVGAALQALGVSEAPLQPVVGNSACEHGDADPVEERDVVLCVTELAVAIARKRDASEVSTTDVLMAVMRVYGADFDRVLRAHGVDYDEIIERLGTAAF